MNGRLMRGELYTVTPHVMWNGSRCGTWHCRVTGTEQDGKVVVQEVKVDGNRWRPSMSTSVRVDVLRPLAVQVDLFGDPAPPDPRRARQRAGAS